MVPLQLLSLNGMTARRSISESRLPRQLTATRSKRYRTFDAVNAPLIPDTLDFCGTPNYN
jgi:hypothetical protein